MDDCILIGVLILQLHSPSWRVRDNASFELSQMPQAWPVLYQLSACENPEVSKRAYHASGAWEDVYIEKLSHEIRPKGYPYLPWADCMPDYNEVMQYREKVPKNIPSGPNQWLQYREATRLWLMDKIRSGESMEEIQRMIELGKQGELHWIANNKHQSPPELFPFLRK